MPDIVAWARRFVATPSVSHDGNEAIAKLAAELLEEVGAQPKLIPELHHGVTHFTLMADLGPPAPANGDGLLLVTHLDTVPPGDAALWTETGGDPFRPTEKDGLLYGLGAADATVDLVCKAAALARLRGRKLRRPLRVVGTFAEEIGLVGARWLVESGHLRGFRQALVGEPSELAAIRAHKGYSVFEAQIPLPRVSVHTGRLEHDEFAGHSAHSSTPQLGRNAIESALGRLSQADTLGVNALEGGGAVNQVPATCTLTRLVRGNGAGCEDVRDARPLVAFHQGWRSLLARLAELKDADFDPDCTVGNLGRVALRDDVCTLTFDLRPIPGTDPEAVVSGLEEFAEIRCLRTNPPLETPADSELVRAVVRAQRAAGAPERVETKATCTEAGLLSAAGLDAIVLGAGRSVGNVHRPNEHTRLSQLEQAAELYAAAIADLCAEPA